ncbi:MAG TPA: hypothetical protein VNI60_06880 [Pyrinomonadaceae bacterium]|nr:hypothetical protein [Pyrinomonadaceae bacterium]
MTKSEVKVLETDVVVFPMELGQNAQEKALAEDIESNLENKKKPIEVDNESRFTRLKKSLRKKSVSIL